MNLEHLYAGAYSALSNNKHAKAIDYLFEISILDFEYYHLTRNHQKDKRNPIASVVYIENLIFRYYPLLEKMAQFINIVWLDSKLKEDRGCSFAKVKANLKEENRHLYELIKPLDTTIVTSILEQRRKMTHQIIVDRGNDFIHFLPLPLLEENQRSFNVWENKSCKTLEDAYIAAFISIGRLLQFLIDSKT